MRYTLDLRHRFQTASGAYGGGLACAPLNVDFGLFAVPVVAAAILECAILSTATEFVEVDRGMAWIPTRSSSSDIEVEYDDND